MNHRTAFLAALIAAVLVLGACGTDSTDPTEAGGTDTTTIPPTDNETTSTSTSGAPIEGIPSETRLLLTFDSGGGFVPVEFNLTDLTDYTVYTDGRVIIGRSDEGYPMPAMPQYRETRIDEETLVQILGLIDRLGIAEITQEANLEMQRTIADASTETATYYDEDGNPHRYSVYALGMSEFEDADGRVAVMKELFDLLNQIDRSGANPVPPTGLQVWIGEVDPDPSFHEVRPWAFDFAPITTSESFGYACRVLTGAEADTAAAALADATNATLWSELDGPAYSVVAKPLLEGEHAECDDIDY